MPFPRCLSISAFGTSLSADDGCTSLGLLDIAPTVYCNMNYLSEISRRDNVTGYSIKRSHVTFIDSYLLRL